MGFISVVRGWMRSVRAEQSSAPGPLNDYWYTDIGQANHAGMTVTPDLALRASAVYACVKFLSETIASLPLQMFRVLPDGGRQPAPDHPLDELLRFQPNGWQTASEFWEMMVLHAALRGTAYAEIVPGPRGAVDQLHPLHTDRVKVERLGDNSLRFEVTDPKTHQKRILLQEEVFRVPGMSSDGVTGLRVIDLAAEAIGLGMAADAYAARVFSNKLNIGGFLVHPGRLSVEAQNNILRALVERFAGATNAHRPILLWDGMKFERATMDAQQAQLLEGRKWQIGEIARYWRIPLHLLGLGERDSDSEQQAQDLVRYTLRPWVRRIEHAIRRDLIVAKTTFEAKFNMEALLRGDAKTRADYFSKGLGSGGSPAWLTQNEVRVIEGFNRIDDPRADMLGVGTNPDTSEPAALLTDETPRARAARLVRKETAAIRRASLRFAGDPTAFGKWVRAFYGGHVSACMAALDIPKEAARSYCNHVRDEVLRSGDLDALLSTWEERRADEIAETLERHAA